MRIAFVLAGLGAGGAERVVSLIASRWVEWGWQVSVIAFDAPQDPVFHAFAPGVEFIRLAIPSSGLGAVIGRAQQLRAALNRLSPDVTISFLTKINALTLLATLGTGLRVIVSERNNARLQAVNPAWKIALALLYRRARQIVIQTEASRAALPAPDRLRATTIPNPVLTPVATIPAPADPPPIITAVGRLTHQKGFDRLIDAFARIAQRHPAWRLVIWGEGPARAKLVAHAASLGLAERIAFPGLSPAPGDWVHQSGLFVLSSRFEGFPNVLAEAMAAGLPAIAFDCDYGPAEMITHGEDGLLVPQNSVAGLSRAIDALLSAPEQRRALGMAARRSITKFAMDPIIERWTNLVITPDFPDDMPSQPRGARRKAQLSGVATSAPPERT